MIASKLMKSDHTPNPQNGNSFKSLDISPLEDEDCIALRFNLKLPNYFVWSQMLE